MRVAATIFHPGPPPEAAPLSRWLQAAKAELAERHAVILTAAGADARIVTGAVAGQSFGARLRELVLGLRGFDGLVVMGSGALALASRADLERFVAAARAPGCALANNRYSADIVAIGGLGPLASAPDLRTDNALPRWLAETQGYRVSDIRHRWRLGVDLDSPIDILLAGLGEPGGRVDPPRGVDLAPVRARLGAAAATTADRQAEVLVAGRTSARALAWLERRAAARVRALVEERGLRAGADGPWADGPWADGPWADGVGAGAGGRRSREPTSVLGALLDSQGPGALGRIVGRLADAAVIDTRVLLAHRLGRDERAWPTSEDRFASDLLLPARIEDPWLRQLTRAALEAPVPIILGGHTLVGPGLPLALAARRSRRQRRLPGRAPAGGS